jgi:hypothetical protein
MLWSERLAMIAVVCALGLIPDFVGLGPIRWLLIAILITIAICLLIYANEKWRPFRSRDKPAPAEEDGVDLSLGNRSRERMRQRGDSQHGSDRSEMDSGPDGD